MYTVNVEDGSDGNEGVVAWGNDSDGSKDSDGESM